MLSTCFLDTRRAGFLQCDLPSSYGVLTLQESGHCGSAKPASDAPGLLLSGNSILHSAADSVTSAVQKASQALNERGERLGRAEEKTEDLKNSAQQFAETAHKVGQERGGLLSSGVLGSYSAKKLYFSIFLS